MQFPITYIFFGNSRFSVRVLEKLVLNKHQPTVVITKSKSPVEFYCQQNNLDCFTYQDLMSKQLTDRLTKSPTSVFIVAGFPLLPKSIFSLPERGCLNVHPSLLPKYRGSLPESAQILCDDRDTGVTVHLIDDQIDHGPIIAQKRLSFADWPPRASYMGKILAEAAGELLVEILPRWIAGEINPRIQAEDGATYTSDYANQSTSVLTHDLDSGTLWKRFQALHDTLGVFFILPDGRKVRILDAYTDRNQFFITQVHVSGEDTPLSFNSFINRKDVQLTSEWSSYFDSTAEC